MRTILLIAMLIIVAFSASKIFGEPVYSDHAALSQMYLQKTINFYLFDHGLESKKKKKRKKSSVYSPLRRLLFDDMMRIDKGDGSLFLGFGLEYLFDNNISMIAGFNAGPFLRFGDDDAGNFAEEYGLYISNEHKNNHAMAGAGFYEFDKYFTLKFLAGYGTYTKSFKLLPNQPETRNHFKEYYIVSCLHVIGILYSQIHFSRYETTGGYKDSGISGISICNPNTYKGNKISRYLMNINLARLYLPVIAEYNYYEFGDITQISLKTSLSAILNSYKLAPLDIILNIKCFDKGYYVKTIYNYDVFGGAAIFVGNARDSFARFRNGYSSFTIDCIILLSSYRNEFEKLSANDIKGFGFEIAYGSITYTKDRSNRIINSKVNDKYKVYYKYSPESYSSPNYEFGFGLTFEL